MPEAPPPLAAPPPGSVVRRAFGAMALAWVVGGMAPTARLWSYGDIYHRETLQLALATLLAAVVLERSGGRRWSWAVVLPVAAAGGAVGVAVNGRFVGAWTALVLVQAAWGVLGQPPVPALRPPDRSVRQPLVLLALLSTVIYLQRDVVPRYAVLLVLGGFVAIATATFDAPLLRAAIRAVERGARALGRAVGAVLLVGVGIVGLVVPWAIQRLLRWDPTGLGGRTVVGWVSRSPARLLPGRLWLAEPIRRRPSGAQRAHGLLVSTCTAAAVLLPVVLVWQSTRPSPPAERAADLPVSGVWLEMSSQPWWNDMSAESAEMFDQSYISQWAGTELRDRTGRYVNIVDGRRKSWVPPRAECPRRVRVWMFGGSTLWGVGNRDEHTVASELARSARREGIALEVHNWGVPGDVSWIQQRRLERALLTEPPPDLVVFYDGGNDIGYVPGINFSDRTEVGDWFGPLDPIHLRLLTNLQKVEGSDEYRSVLRSWREVVELTDEELADRAAAQYAHAHASTSLVLAEAGIPFVHVLQPTLATRDGRRVGEPEVAPQVEAITEAFIEQLPDDVVDLTDAFDDVRDAHFNDDVHVDEAGNVVIADAMVEALREQLELLAEEEGATCP